jgi:hypothetical protein
MIREFEKKLDRHTATACLHFNLYLANELFDASICTSPPAHRRRKSEGDEVA